MKMNKILAVLLSVVMLCCMMPAITLSVSAGVGEITNGGFETGDFTGWSYYTYSTSIVTSTVQAGSYAVNIGKDSTLAGHIALEQVVPVNTNATYSLSFYNRRTSWGFSGNCSFSVSVELGMTPSSFTATGLSASTPSNSNSYTKRTYSFSTSTYKYARIRFNALGSGVDTRLDTIALTATVTGDEGTHAAPTLMSFGTEYNRPNSDANNIIVQPGFESTTNAQWNTSSFLANGVEVKEDASIAHSGSKYLYYYRGSVAPTTWSMFEITCPTAGEYVFSAWVRTPYLSSTNKGQASIGVIDRDTGKFLTYSGSDYYGHYSTPEIQIRSTATDDEWHLRSVTFYVGAANSNVNIGMYGLQSTMYVDDISVHLLSNGVKYEGDQKGTLSASTSVTNKFCESENNLVPDCNMNGDLSEEFWSGASGWNNGFLEFGEDATASAHGNTLHYKGTNPGSNKLYNYIKWVYVEPNTSYTVSFDYRVASAGNQLMFIDNNIESPQVFHTPSLGSASNTWNTYAFTFNSGNYKRIGIVLRDHASAELYFDDFRFFKTSDGIADEPAEEIFPTLKHNKGEDNAVLESRMEMGEGNLGLAFLFNLEATGVTRDNKFIGNYTNGMVQAFEDGVDYKLVKAGAVVTNKDEIGQDEKAFKLDNVQTDKTVVDVNAKYLFYNPNYETSPGYDPALGYDPAIYYAIRITNIPESAISKTIYVRPYYVFEYNGEQVTVYGDIVYDCYEEIPDINDGWLEWD